MRDEHCVCFLQWALPQLHLRWAGFRKVRRQVCKRVDRRVLELGLADVEAYRAWLEQHPDEWKHLETLCRITISRFYRDRGVFDALAEQVLPSLFDGVRLRGEKVLRIWSAGCGSGEEPYTLALIWHCALRPRFPGMGIDIVGTDADARMLERALAARYSSGSLRELPAPWRDRAFIRDHDTYRLAPDYRCGVRFVAQDILQQCPEGRFDLVLCRNLAFTYFDQQLQSRILGRIVAAMHDGAALVLGAHERLPDAAHGLSAWFGKRSIYRRASAAGRQSMDQASGVRKTQVTPPGPCGCE